MCQLKKDAPMKPITFFALLRNFYLVKIIRFYDRISYQKRRNHLQSEVLSYYWFFLQCSNIRKVRNADHWTCTFCLNDIMDILWCSLGFFKKDCFHIRRFIQIIYQLLLMHPLRSIVFSKDKNIFFKTMSRHIFTDIKIQ